jgi:signal transduction histidine kinase
MSFFSDIAHELRTPLTVAITNLAVLESHRAESVESQQKWIDFMKFQLNRLTRLVNDMLFLESVDAWDPYEGLEQVDLSSLVDRCVKSMGALIEEKRITLITNIQEAVFMNAHGELMTRLISVLVDNAIKYTPEGGVISVSLSQSVAATVLTVENTGEGIEPENLNRVFDRLFRVSKSRSRDEGGSGLGLAIAKSVVEKYGGSISVDSKVGEKTTFQVRIPR